MPGKTDAGNDEYGNSHTHVEPIDQYKSETVSRRKRTEQGTGRSRGVLPWTQAPLGPTDCKEIAVNLVMMISFFFSPFTTFSSISRSRTQDLPRMIRRKLSKTKQKQDLQNRMTRATERMETATAKQVRTATTCECDNMLAGSCSAVRGAPRCTPGRLARNRLFATVQQTASYGHNQVPNLSHTKERGPTQKHS